MGYDLYTVSENSSIEYFRWNNSTWPAVLTLASAHGLTPLGTFLYEITEKDLTEHPHITEADMISHNQMVKDWEGCYTSNDGATVGDQYAFNMAVSIESCLDDIPNHTIPIPGSNDDRSVSLPLPEIYTKHRNSMMQGSKPALYVMFSGSDSKTYLRKFIKFLKQGAYNIH